MDKLAAYIVREGALSTYDAVGWIVRLAATLEPIHDLGVSHGRVSAKAVQIQDADCRSEGFLLDAGDLADDAAYYSPERCSGGVRSPQSDTWAVGVTLYQALTGTLPFPGTTASAVAQRIHAAPPAPLAVFDVGDDELQMLLDRVLTADKGRRLDSLAGLRRALIERDRAYGALEQLHYGRPEDTGRAAPAGDDGDEDDEDGAFLTTSVLPRRELFDATEAVRRAKERTTRSVDELARTVPMRDAPPELVAMLGKTMPMRDAPPALGALDKTIPSASDPSALPMRSAGPRGFGGPAPPLRGEHISVDLVSEETSETDRLPVPRSLLDDDTSDSDDDDFDLPRRDSSDVIALSIADSLSRAPPARMQAPPTPAVDLALTSQPAPAGTARTWRPRKRGTFWRMWIAAWLLIGVGGLAAYFLRGWPRGFTNPFAPRPSAAPALPPTARTTDSGARAASASSPPAQAMPSAATAVAGGTADADAAVVTDLRACVDPLFPEQTFSPLARDFEFLCTEKSPYRGASRLHALVVLGRSGETGVTDAMREWSNLGWYGMAAFAVVRARCCQAPTPFVTTTTLTQCELDRSLDELGKTVFAGDNAEVEAALRAYTQAIHCIARGGAAHLFGHVGYPQGGELSTFKKTLLRARKLVVRRQD